MTKLRPNGVIQIYYYYYYCTFKITSSSSYHIVDLKRQNRLKVGTNKPKLKVKMQSVSDDDAELLGIHLHLLHRVGLNVNRPN